MKAKGEWVIPEILKLYRDESTPVLNVDEVAAYLEEHLGIKTETREDFLASLSMKDTESIAAKLAETRVRDLEKPFHAEEAAYGEVAFETRFLDDRTRKVPGVLYDGLHLQKLFRGMIPPRERNIKTQHIIFTSRLIGTFEADGRYHAHVNLCGYPSIISTSGAVEAPAKPKEYYVLKQRFIDAGGSVPFELLKDRFAGTFIDYDDPRITEVMKGYALQCAFNAITSEPFCEVRRCRLFDSHWQSELIEAQLGGDRFCKRHKDMLTAVRRVSES